MMCNFKETGKEKESNETIYWISILEPSDVIGFTKARSLYDSAEELLKLLTSIIKSMKRKLR